MAWIIREVLLQYRVQLVVYVAWRHGCGVFRLANVPDMPAGEERLVTFQTVVARSVSSGGYALFGLSGDRKSSGVGNDFGASPANP